MRIERSRIAPMSAAVRRDLNHRGGIRTCVASRNSTIVRPRDVDMAFPVCRDVEFPVVAAMVADENRSGKSFRASDGSFGQRNRDDDEERDHPSYNDEPAPHWIPRMQDARRPLKGFSPARRENEDR